MICHVMGHPPVGYKKANGASRVAYQSDAHVYVALITLDFEHNYLHTLMLSSVHVTQNDLLSWFDIIFKYWKHYNNGKVSRVHT